MPLPTHSRTPPQLEITDACPEDVDVKAVDADGASIAADDRGSDDASRSRPSRPGDNASAAARSRGTAAGGGGGVAGSAAGVKEGATTDQEESGGRGGQRERARPTSAQSAKSSSSSSKVEEELSVLRIGGTGTGADGVSSAGDGPAGGLLLDSVEHRVRQDSSRSPLPHENAAGGEDDASVLDTPLQDKVREKEGSLPKALTRLWFLMYMLLWLICPGGEEGGVSARAETNSTGQHLQRLCRRSNVSRYLFLLQVHKYSILQLSGAEQHHLTKPEFSP